MISRNRKIEGRLDSGDMTMRRWHRVFAEACRRSGNMFLVIGVIAMITTMIAPMIAPATMNASATTAASQPRLIALEGSPGPAEIGGTYSKIISAAVDNSGDVAFSATLSDSSASSAILLKSADTIRVLLRSGDKAPDGSTYKKFDELDRSFYGFNGVDAALMIFRAELEGGSASEGLFLMKPDRMQVIALAGGKSPRGFTYKSFARPTLIAEHSNRGLEWTLTFIGLMEEGNKSLVNMFSISQPEEWTTGDQLGNAVLRDFVISQMGGEAVSAVADMHDLSSDRNYKEVIFIGGNILSGTNFRTRGRIKGFGRIKQILTPPAINFQVSIASVVFKGGQSAIVAREVLGGAFAIAAAGDPAPGLAGETIQSFGPPVSNAVFPFESSTQRFPDGIVSVVKLSGGRSALWLWTRKVVFPGPDIIQTKLVWLEGDTTTEGQVARNFSPIKLSDKGTLLLRGTIGEGISAREGLFVIDGLFDELPQ
jgi:hypothetical protein